MTWRSPATTLTCETDDHAGDLRVDGERHRVHCVILQRGLLKQQDSRRGYNESEDGVVTHRRVVVVEYEVRLRRGRSRGRRRGWNRRRRRRLRFSLKRLKFARVHPWDRLELGDRFQGRLGRHALHAVVLHLELRRLDRIVTHRGCAEHELDVVRRRV